MKVKELMLRLSEYNLEEEVNFIEVLNENEAKSFQCVRVEKVVSDGKNDSVGVFVQ